MTVAKNGKWLFGTDQSESRVVTWEIGLRGRTEHTTIAKSGRPSIIARSGPTFPGYVTPDLDLAIHDVKILDVKDITVKGLQVRVFNYECSVTNHGSASIPYQAIGVQNYSSPDAVFDADGDSPAGGSVLAVRYDSLAPGESAMDSCSAHFTVEEGPYLIVRVSAIDIQEQNESNNTVAIDTRTLDASADEQRR